MKSFVTASQARQNFFQLLEQTEKPGAAVTVTVGGVPKVVMISFDELEGWKETYEIMADKDAMERIEIALKEGGRLYSHEEIKKKFHLS